jgi:hypothetical protein
MAISRTIAAVGAQAARRESQVKNRRRIPKAMEKIRYWTNCGGVVAVKTGSGRK